MWGIPYAIVERMLIDAPSYESSTDDKPKEEKKTLTADNKTELMNELNAMFDD